MDSLSLLVREETCKAWSGYSLYEVWHSWVFFGKSMAGFYYVPSRRFRPGRSQEVRGFLCTRYLLLFGPKVGEVILVVLLRVLM